MKKLTICFVLPDLAIIGAQRVAIELGRKLHAEGHAIHWLCGDGGTWLDELKEMEIHFFSPKTFPSVRGLRMLERLVRLGKSLADMKFDVVISVTPFMNRVVCLLKLLSACRAHLVIEDHAYPPRSYPDEFPRRWERLLYRHTEWLYGQADVMRTLTEDSLHYYQSRQPHLNAKAFPNLLDIERLRLSARAGIPEAAAEQTDLVYIGRFTTQKNLGFLIDCFARLLERRPTTLTIIGYGPEEAQLHQKIQDLGIGASVRFVQSGPDNLRHLSRAKVFPFVSRWEGFPLVLVEAMSVGAAIVSVDCKTGPRELLGVDSSRGWLVREDDPDAFVEALFEALSSEPERTRRTGNALAHVLENLDIRKKFPAYFKIFIDPQQKNHNR